MEEYRVEVRIKNNLILSKIESLGYKSLSAFCRENDICLGSLINCSNMKQSIYTASGAIRPFVINLCDVLRCSPEEIFSAAQMEAALRTNKRTLLVNEAEARFMLENSEEIPLLEDQYDKEKMHEKMNDILATLTPRERKVIEMRIGLGEYTEPLTLDQTAEKISNHWGTQEGVSRERIRQIEQKALRKLRHPMRSKELRKYLEE